jgi:hypothetical protein
MGKTLRAVGAWIAGNLVWQFGLPVVGGLGVAVWALLGNLPAPTIAVLGLSAVAALLAIIRLGISLWDRSRIPQQVAKASAEPLVPHHQMLPSGNILLTLTGDLRAINAWDCFVHRGNPPVHASYLDRHAYIPRGSDSQLLARYPEHFPADKGASAPDGFYRVRWLQDYANQRAPSRELAQDVFVKEGTRLREPTAADWSAGKG